MNREQAKLLAPVIAAFGEGRDIQYSMSGGIWITYTGNTHDPIITSFGYNWRIKPEPREWWVNIYPNDAMIHENKESADISANLSRIECIRVREIID